MGAAVRELTHIFLTWRFWVTMSGVWAIELGLYWLLGHEWMEVLGSLGVLLGFVAFYVSLDWNERAGVM